MPGIGGFLAQQHAATCLEAEDVFLPPVRIIRFNAELNNDSENVFESSLMSIYRLSREQAHERCTQYARTFNETLEQEGTLDFGSLGVFSINDGKVSFSPCEAGATTPAYYGLDTFHMPMLRPEQMAPVNKVVRMTSIKTDDKQITISFNRRIVNYAASIAAAIIMCVMYNTTIDKSTTTSTTTASIAMPMNVSPLDVKAASTPAIVLPNESSEKTEADKTSEVTKVTSISVEDNKNLGKYALVFESKVGMDEAKQYVVELQKKGLEEVKLITRNGKPSVAEVGFKHRKNANIRRKELLKEGLIDKAQIIRLR